MKIDGYRAWLQMQDYAEGTVGTRISDARRVEQHYGNLDEAYDRDRCEGVLEALVYSSQDAAQGLKNPTNIPITGNLSRGLSGYRSSVNAYRRFRDGELSQAGGAGLTREAVLRELARFEQAGSLDNYLSSFDDLGSPQSYWLVHGGRRYPSKAIVHGALGLTTRLHGGSQCRKMLGSLGFLVLNTRAFNELRDAFLRRMEPFTDFHAKHGPYWDIERSYKDQLIGEVREIAASEASDADVGQAILKKLGRGKGAPLSWMALDAIEKSSPSIRDAVYAALGNLVRHEGPGDEAMLGAARVLEAARRQGVGQLAIGNVLSVVASVRGTVRPDEASWFKISKIREAGKRLFDRSLFPAPEVRGEDLAEYDQIMRALRGELENELGWSPADLFDVQGFLWVSLSTAEEWGEEDVPAFSGGSVGQAEAEDDAMREFLMPPPTNLILYGPPGTGKTYATAREAVALCDGEALSDRAELMERYEELRRNGRIGFVTFHQSFSYEDFVEGLRPVTESSSNGEEGSGGFSLQPQDGIFKQMADVAAANRGKAVSPPVAALDRDRKVFKMSLGRAGIEDYVYQEALAEGYVVLGWGGDVDWSDPRYDNWEAIKERWRQDHPDASGNDPNMSQMYTFRIAMQPGSLVVISDGNRKFRAIGEIAGPYRFAPGPNGEFNHRREVRWLWRAEHSLPHALIYEKVLSQVSAYQLNNSFIRWEGLEQIISSGDIGEHSGPPQPHVLIIDEINRANVSKVFGELITLIEPDKRQGMDNALTVRLPYSKDEFGVPANLHIIGTMNTADRSIALLDTALRRRFRFKEIGPDAKLLPEHVGEVPLRAVLETINDRIEYLVDRDHRIGHAFFMGAGGKDRAGIDAAMRDKVIPLLQEYFFEDWSRIAAVVGKGFVEQRKLPAPPGIEYGEPKISWAIRDELLPDAYWILLGKAAAETPANDEAFDEDGASGVATGE